MHREREGPLSRATPSDPPRCGVFASLTRVAVLFKEPVLCYNTVLSRAGRSLSGPLRIQHPTKLPSATRVTTQELSISTPFQSASVSGIASPALLETTLEGCPRRRGKVRDIYDLGDRLLIVATDRISAFDWVLPTGIPDKGRILTGLSAFWFAKLGCENHLITTDVRELPFVPGLAEELQGRFMLVRKTEVVPIECVARGYLAGSGWKEYQQAGTVCGIKLKPGLAQSARLAEPIFTPATKADQGHDENISFERMVEFVGAATAEELRRRTFELYSQAAAYCEQRGLLLADTKLEWGRLGGQFILIDEVFTPDSSRFWPQDGYAPGKAQPAFDKQFVRDWLETSGWDKNSDPPALPPEIVARTREKYIDAYERLTEQPFPWK
jgi:phosphoribosylaminoimidazole-succinocarboxamide synthase